ncbi:Ubiquitin-like protein [Ceraceosorus bombacis]|uniref:Ubiquitin-like protein n=1 Tax=Ceraceosorus bombacis TaxID=401625 RepID=A0A0P1BI54_9BASI|nr:Ubiquitin-like protein [Ceraceosorus bombacis]
MADSAQEISVNIKGPSELRLSVKIATDATIRQLKEKIQEQKPEVTAESQRLIYSGKVLKDDETVAFYKLVNGHTIHMVRSASRSAPTTGNPSTGSAPSASSTNASGSSAANSAAQGVPANFGAGQQFANNPLSALNRADYAGPQLTAAQNQMFDGMNVQDPNFMMNMLENDSFRQQLRETLSRPEMIDQLIDANPQLRNMPGARDMLRSPFFIDMMTDPATMRRAAQFSQMMGGGAGGGAGGAGMFGGGGQAPQWPPPGAFGTGGEQGPGQGQNQAGGAPGSSAAQNPFAALGALGGQGAGGSGGAGGMMDPSFLRSLFGEGGPGGAGAGSPPAGNPFAGGANPFAAALGGLGGFGGGTPPAPADGRPHEERYADELAQMQAMGLTDGPRNLRALLLAGGNVQGAINIIFDGGAN